MTGTRAPPRLVVRESNGKEKAGYRLFWKLEGGNLYPALEFAFDPFGTVEEAVAFGEREYGVEAERPS